MRTMTTRQHGRQTAFQIALHAAVAEKITPLEFRHGNRQADAAPDQHHDMAGMVGAGSRREVQEKHKGMSHAVKSVGPEVGPRAVVPHARRASSRTQLYIGSIENIALL